MIDWELLISMSKELYIITCRLPMKKQGRGGYEKDPEIKALED